LKSSSLKEKVKLRKELWVHQVCPVPYGTGVVVFFSLSFLGRKTGVLLREGLDSFFLKREEGGLFGNHIRF
jgi:hypothetical protein